MLLVSSFRRDLLFILLPLVVDCCSYITIRTSHDMIYQLKFEKDYTLSLDLAPQSHNTPFEFGSVSSNQLPVCSPYSLLLSSIVGSL